MPYTPITGTLAYLLRIGSTGSGEVLLVHRNARADDEQFGKWNGLGGKLESHEDIAAGMRRELREEALIEVTAMTLRGTVNWPGFGPNGEDWIGYIFLVTGWTGDIPTANEEGPLEWISVDRISVACSADEVVRETAHLPMWEGDRYFLPLVFDDDTRQFHGVMPYAQGRPTSWTVERW
jgi:8-oxo-dGTP diphosphatase